MYGYIFMNTHTYIYILYIFVCMVVIFKCPNCPACDTFIFYFTFLIITSGPV